MVSFILSLLSSIPSLLLGIGVLFFLSALPEEVNAQTHPQPVDEVAQLLQAGHWEEAQKKIDQGLKAQPQSVTLRFQKGVLAWEQGRLGEAAEIFQRLTQDHPHLPEPYNNLAAVYAAQGKMGKARSILEQAMRTHLSYATTQTNLANIYTRMAAQAYGKALQMDTDKTLATAQLSVLRYVSDPQLQTKPPQADTSASSWISKRALPSSTAGAKTSPSSTAPTAALSSTASLARPAPTPPVATAAAPPSSRAQPTAPPESPSIKPSPASQKGGETEVRDAVLAWAHAWQGKNIKRYIASYTNRYTPGGGVTRSTWESQRRERIEGKAKIEVRVSDLQIRFQGEDKAIARFRQAYRSGSLATSGNKTLELIREGNAWKIIRESI